MILYYYTAKQWGMKSLWEKRLKIAEYNDLNDPFELQPFDQTEDENRKLSQQIKTVLAQINGVLCFSESWQSTLMWAHYGDKHKGICLGFEIEEGPHLTKIEYVSSRIRRPVAVKVDDAMLEQCLNVKHNGWEYEKEYRLRASLNDKRDGIYYNNFNDGMALREVIIGARSSLSVVDVVEAIGKEPDSDVRILFAHESHNDFNMCENTNKQGAIVEGISPELKRSRQLAKALLKGNS